ncbi:MAG: hypothetical protein JWM47_2400 [Acidimicrobiales bacterium]|nr:hypothetical protein [Acidimicrobiales bacterium]
MSETTVDLRVDFNTQDETGLPWTYVEAAVDPGRIVPGRYLIAGAGSAVAVAQVVDVADDGLVHVRPIRGTVDDNRHLLDPGPPEA